MSDAAGAVALPGATLLLDIYQTLGRIEGQNELILKEQHEEAKARADAQAYVRRIEDVQKGMARDIAAMKARVDIIEPQVEKNKTFRMQVAVVVTLTTAVVTGSFEMFWHALTHLHQIKAALDGFFK